MRAFSCELLVGLCWCICIGGSEFEVRVWCGNVSVYVCVYVGRVYVCICVCERAYVCGCVCSVYVRGVILWYVESNLLMCVLVWVYR